MCVLLPYPKYADSILANRDNPDQVIKCIKLPGREIPESMFRIAKVRLNLTRLNRFFEQ